MCREVRRTIRLYIDSERDFQHARRRPGGELRQLRHFASIALLSIGGAARAQSATIPASSSLYDNLESVSALFPTRGVHLGLRSLSRLELRRIVAALEKTVDSGDSAADPRRAWARRELASISAALNEERRVGARTRLETAWRVEMFSSDALSERITDNGLGRIDATAHPFAPRRYALPTGQGSIATALPTVLLEAGDRFSLAAEPRISVGHFRDGARAEDVFIHRGYARGVLRNVALQLGADELRWGQSPLGALFISGNAAPLPALQVGTDTAIMLPWLFRLAGPLHLRVLLADLGPSQVPPRAKLAGWQVSMQPWSRLELGVSLLAHTGGGEGGDSIPDVSFIERLADLLPVLGAAFPKYDNPISNKLAGGHLRLRIPELSALDLYYELQLDDFDGRRIRSSFVDDAAHLVGARLPLLVGAAQLSWRAEWQRTSLRLYEHSQYASGVTYRERIIGNPLGPHGSAAVVAATWSRSPLTPIELVVADERRDPSLFTVTGSTRDTAFKFIRVTDDARYRRRRAALSVQRMLPTGALRMTIGYNRAWRTGQSARNEWLGLLAFRSQRLPTF